ncbi:hypothetical protein M0R45_037653 [Rubus argutus]|uniref:Uncharacterized protein n=1 Tax=Rubus argutus TaxID=59490 RepID=A0AAW1W0P1_RUBAR
MALLHILFLFLVVSSSTSGRLLNDNVSQNPSILVLPCHTHDGETGFRATPNPGFGAAAANRKYGPLVLNMLPKGTTTPSGPSKGTNSLNS